MDVFSISFSDTAASLGLCVHFPGALARATP